jgi:DNA helicase-2/ATP-dependent DNA helicase PcrA
LTEVHGVPPEEILVITFAKAASVEMKKRFLALTGEKDSKVTFATFHSFFFTVIRRFFGYTLENVLSEDARREVIKQAVASLDLGFDEGDDFLQQVMNELSTVKNELIDLAYHSPIDLPAETFREAARLYDEWKRVNNKIDFDDMLTKCYALIKENKTALAHWRKRYRYIMIDEFQDINRVQYETIRLFAAPLFNLFVVGDDDQSIYRFRGSRPEFLLHLNQDFPGLKSVILNINYRSTDKIIALCNRVIACNANRYKKDIRGTNVPGVQPLLISPENPQQEALMIAKQIKRLGETGGFGGFAVIYRTNIQSRPLVDVFIDLNIPFRIKDDAPGIYEHWISKDVCAYFRLALLREDNAAFERIANKPNRYVSKAALAAARKRGGSVLSALYDDKTTPVWLRTRLEELMFYLNALKTRSPKDAFRYLRQAIGYDDYLREYAAYRKMNAKGLFEVLTELAEAAKGYDTLSAYINHADDVIQKTKADRLAKKQQTITQEGVTLSTMHGVKGLEYDTVFVTSIVEGIVPYEKSKTAPELEEECRMLYVALTRAKRQLVLSVIKTRNEAEAEQSRYLKDIEPALYKKGVFTL